ncbi:G-protein coupled receptor 4-like [Odontesthes bonariensis]|uniref:G-protein coupled receptor 4-like n=1 Tax=Odontesthes bonariensis TaxID=219752 RepID=UPI003F58186C
MEMDYFSLNINYWDNYYYDYENDTIFEEFEIYGKEYGPPTVSYVIAWLVMLIGFPLTLLAIYALHSLIRDEPVAPVYVINLLISDLIQISCLVIWVVERRQRGVLYASTIIYFFGVLASVGFMVCVALERYLVFGCPLWYRFRRNTKLSVMVSLVVWLICLLELLVAMLMPNFYHLIFRFAFLLLPFPFLVFCLAGTLKALFDVRSVPTKEKRRIVGTLVLVLLNYTVMFMPSVARLLRMICRYPVNNAEDSYYGLSLAFLQFSPLSDLVLYVFLKKGATEKLLACLCCCDVLKEEESSQGTTTQDVH